MRFEVDRPIFETDVRGRVKEGFVPTPQAILLANPLSTTQDLPDEINILYLADLKQEGYATGAVVVHTRLALEKRIDPNEWGFIVGYNGKVLPGDKPKLMKVKWASGSYEACSEKELLIVYRPTWSSEDILKEKLNKRPLT